MPGSKDEAADATLSVPFPEATKVWALDSHTYEAFLHEEYMVGSVPHGGYVATCFLKIASLHLREQPDAMIAHFEFLSRTESGPAVFVVEEAKRGRQISVLHITLYQQGLLPRAPWITPGVSRREVAAYISQTDLSREAGLTLPTVWSLLPPPAPIPANLARVAEGTDPHWQRFYVQAHKFRPVFNALEYYSPRAGDRLVSITDRWVRLSGAMGGRFTNASLGFLADAWPFPVEAYRTPQPPRDPSTGKRRPLPPPEPGSIREVAESQGFTWKTIYWYPTLVMNLEIKKPLPPEGVEWLFMRAMAKQIRNGRLDNEILILDETGALVAICSHVNLVLGANRNLEERKTTAAGGTGGGGTTGEQDMKSKSHI